MSESHKKIEGTYYSCILSVGETNVQKKRERKRVQESKREKQCESREGPFFVGLCGFVFLFFFHVFGCRVLVVFLF